MKLERFIHKCYRFSALKEVGKIGLTTFVLVLLTGLYAWIFLGTDAESDFDTYAKQDRQYLAIDPVNVKKDDAYFHLFLQQIRKHNGVLVLGTSESGFKDGYNYWELLNNDPDIETDFSVLYGAGRSTERYIPSILNHPENWEKQRLLVFVNPVYWRKGLDVFNLEYHERYLDITELRKAREKADNKERYDLLYGGGKSLMSPSLTERVSNVMDKKVHRLYYENLRRVLLGIPKTRIFTDFGKPFDPSHQFSAERLAELKKETDSTFNCTHEFIEHKDLHISILDVNANYRNTALTYFMELCKKHKIDATFIIGPYNQTMGEASGDTQAMQTYDEIHKMLRSLMEKEGFPYIDLYDLSPVNLTFDDQQHHSKYGGYLIYQRIKEYYDEKVDH